MKRDARIIYHLSICLISFFMIGLLKLNQVHGYEKISSAENLKTYLNGSWTGSLMSARFILEFNNNKNVLLTTISAKALRNASYEPVFSHGTYETDNMDEHSVKIDLIRNEDKNTLRCSVNDQGNLDCIINEKETIGFTRDEESKFNWGLWGTYYYLNPQPDKFVTAARSMAVNGTLNQQRHMIADLMMLMASIMNQNPGLIPEWMSKVDRNTYKGFWDDALFYSGTEQGTYILLEEGKKKGRRYAKFIKEGAPVVYEIDPEGPDRIDMLWGYFFATGDTKAVRNIIRAFNYVKYEPYVAAWESSKKTKRDAKNYNLGAAYNSARWSIQANCTQHSRVLKFCDELVKTDRLTKDESTVLQSILSEADVEMARKHYIVK